MFVIEQYRKLRAHTEIKFVFQLRLLCLSIKYTHIAVDYR